MTPLEISSGVAPAPALAARRASVFIMPCSRHAFPRAALWPLIVILTQGAAALRAAGPSEVVRLDPYATVAPREPRSGAGVDFAGLPGDWREAPRVLTQAGRDELDDWSIRRMEELALLTPGALNAPLYGLAGAPTVRGESGDAAQNGQRRAFNRNMFPVSFNGVEAAEVLAGAPPPSFGYTAGAGGCVNLVTKRPSFDGPRATLGATLGAWAERRAEFDATAPVSSRLAWRLSIERVDRGSFYRLADERSWDTYLALAWRPQADTRWDFSVETYQAHFLENPGTNRPTQALIDRGEYITGSSVQGGGGGAFFRNTFTPSGTVRIDGSQILAAPGDGAWARTLTAQLTGVWRCAGGRRWTSRTYFESVAAEKHAAYHFYSYVPRSRTFEQRIEAAEDRRWGGAVHALQWGAAVRGEERESYVDFLNEAMNAFDLTLDPATVRFPPERFFAVRPVPGKDGRVAVPGGRYGTPSSTGISQTLRSRLASAGVFVADRITLAPGLVLALDWRGDALSVQAEDPLPPPGFAPARDELTRFLHGGAASLGWTRGAATLYGTFNDAAAVETSSSSGGFGLTDNRLPGELFDNRSRLWEAGIKAVAPDGRGRAGLALYHQRRHRMNPRIGRPDEIEVRGAELTGEWRAGRRWELTGNAAWLDARYVDGPLPGSIATVPGFAPDTPSPNFGAFTPGNHRLPGQPRWLAGIMTRCALGRGWTLRLWGRLQGAQDLDLFGRVRIPARQTWNAGVTWRHRAWELRADVLNLTDEFNWRPTSTPFAGGDLVTRELPRHWRASFQRRF